jgi:hypothetical protein
VRQSRMVQIVVAVCASRICRDLFPAALEQPGMADALVALAEGKIIAIVETGISPAFR